LKLLLRNILFSGILLAIVYGIKSSDYAQNIHSLIYWILGFYLLKSLLIGWIMEMATTESSNFAILGLGSTVLRMIIAIFAMLLAVIAGVDDVKLFILNFFTIYLAYLIFELKFVLSNLRQNSSKE
jgi:hypothetical protein